MSDSNYPDDRSGCALSCLAHLSGRGYGEIRELWLRECGGDEWRLKAVGDAGLYVDEVLKLSRLLGLDIPVVNAPGPAVLLLRDARLGFGHYVVVTAEGKVVDPSEEQDA